MPKTEQSLCLVAEMSDIRTIGKLHERNPFYLPVVRITGGKGIFANDDVLEAELLPFPRTGCVPYAERSVTPL